jgi:Xaa-Pro aminopeptidase
MSKQPIHNAAALDRAFSENNLDALVLRSGRNVAYFTRMLFHFTLGRFQDFPHTPRPVVCVWPRNGNPTIFASNIAAIVAKRDSWIEDVRAYTDYAESAYTLSANCLIDQGLSRGRIGIELREWSVADWEEFRKALPSAEIIDCSDILTGVRAIKTDAEIELFKESVRIQDQAHIDVFSNARPGMTEKQLHTQMVNRMLELGADACITPNGMMQASTNPVTYGGEGEVPVTNGVAVRTDYVSFYEGYPANLSRMAVMKKPTSEQEHLYGVALQAHRSAIKMLRAGVKASDVYGCVRASFKAAGYPTTWGLAGHGVGVWWHQEEPFITPAEQRVLAPGMVVCLEPALLGYWHVQDQFVITEGDPVLLSPQFDTSKLFVMG